MKTFICYRSWLMMALIIGLSVIPIYSCSSDMEAPVTPPGETGNPNPQPEPEEDKVITLSVNVGANDALSLGTDGTVFASNFGNFEGTQVVGFDPESMTSEIAVSDLQAPTGNLSDASGNFYVVHNVRRVAPDSNQTIGDVIKIASDGTRTTIATLPGFPSGITMDDEGNIYVSNFSFPGVHKIDAAQEVSLYVQDQRLAGGVGIDFDDDGNLFVGNFSTGGILKINPDQTIEVLATIPTVQANFVIGYITYLEGFIFATAVGEHVIYRISATTGDAAIFAGNGTQGTMDGSLLGASFDSPNGIVGDADRNVLYVTGAGGSLRSIALD